MINFPIFERLEVTGYGLYPGTKTKPGLKIDFKPGLTLILGANGLGKTTLITMLYRMLSGGWELSRSTLAAAELGGASLEAYRMGATDRGVFGQRVQDLAEDAEATLIFKLADKRLKIRRRLDNLGLISLQVDSGDFITDEDTYLEILPQLSGVPTFGDWLLLLRHLVFYFEDRRSLVWDSSAQRQILRVIFLPAREARAWYTKEREILQLDSQVRNLTNALNRLRKRVQADEKASGDEASLRARFSSLARLQEKDEASRKSFLAESEELDELRHRFRRELLDAELKADASARRLEAEKLLLLERYFPSGEETTRYLYSLLISHGRCAACGQDNDKASQELSQRIAELNCIVCGSDLPDSTSAASNGVVPLDKARVEQLRNEHERNRARVTAVDKALEKAMGKFGIVLQRLTELKGQIDDRARDLIRIQNALPATDSKQAKLKEELTEVGARIAEDKTQLAALAIEFVRLIESANVRILAHSDEVKQTFGEFADGFLFEKANLKWSPNPTAVGQLGLAKVTFPAFELDMSGTDFTGPMRRTGPDSVSESQREFIDLAFRMALMHVASEGLGGSLVLDAPESSLDAVFVKRAAEVLCRFGRVDRRNRLVIASNLIDGELLPELIKGGIKPRDREKRLVNLMEVAVPTAALRQNEKAYGSELAKILKAGGLT